ncbi:MAG: RNA 3'-terminal phosphate cyclase [Candidatus Brocadiales bacterium]
MRPLRIDGSFGEGGGQILRTSLTLSAITGTPFEIFNIRAGRKAPGLRPQHLQAVRAIQQVSGASVKGVEVGSESVTFTPGSINPGEYRFEIGTAGSVSLVLQTIFLPLALLSTTKKHSKIHILGGTHVPWSPCFHYLKLQWLRYIERLGLDAHIEMPRAGFYPRGGGEIVIEISPAGDIKPLTLEERGPLRGISGISAVGNLPEHILRRQREQAERRLAKGGVTCPLDIKEEKMPATGQGTMLLLLGEFEHSQCCYYGLGAIGKRAEAVADEAVDGLFSFLKTEGVIDEHLADQLVLPLALSKESSRFVTPKVTQHLMTNIEVIKKFLPVRIEVEDMGDKGGVVSISR